jgi:intein/homing endonuclease
MYDGKSKKIQDIVVGDVLMGDDSKPRHVHDIQIEYDDLYILQPTKGEPFGVSKQHTLKLKHSCMGIERLKTKVPSFSTRTVDKENMKLHISHFKKHEDAKSFLSSLSEEDKIINISVSDYIGKSSKFKSNFKVFRQPVRFQHKQPLFDPYIIGVWLGDGGKRSTIITNQEATILNYINKSIKQHNLLLTYQSQYDYRISYNSSHCNPGQNVFLNALKDYDLINNKHIPYLLRCNSHEVRLHVLAGLLDTDGSLDSNCYEITQENEALMDDIIYLARSLGFAAYKKVRKGSYTKRNGERFVGTYYRCFISGEEIQTVPVKVARKKATKRKQIKDVLVSGFTLTEHGYGKCYTLKIDGNGRHLLSNFVVC